ncbi:MAG: GDSL-type esterase/lipase family protein [Phycisphaerae bacterium]|jgi:beta-glucosidase
MKKIFISLFCFSIICNCAIAAQNPCDVKLGSSSAVTPADRADKDWWLPRHNVILERNKGNVDIIMVGDSITHYWERDAGKAVWEKYYANRNIVNMGFSGDRTQHVLWRLEHGEVNDINPKLAIIMIGTNNSNGEDNTAQEIADGVKAIVCQLRTRLPNTKILILAIFPRGDADQRKIKEQDASYNDQWAKNDKANKIISKIADRKMIYYLDINKKFLNKKAMLTRDVFPDLLHPGQKGYEIWAKAMEPMIDKLTNEKK